MFNLFLFQELPHLHVCILHNIYLKLNLDRIQIEGVVQIKGSIVVKISFMKFFYQALEISK